jgi:hypothetical protein
MLGRRLLESIPVSWRQDLFGIGTLCSLARVFYMGVVLGQSVRRMLSGEVGLASFLRILRLQKTFLQYLLVPPLSSADFR